MFGNTRLALENQILNYIIDKNMTTVSLYDKLLLLTRTQQVIADLSARWRQFQPLNVFKRLPTGYVK